MAKFTWNIEERQFSVIYHTDKGEQIMAQSSSMSTFLKCVGDMLQIAHPNQERTEFEIKKPDVRPSGWKETLYDAYLLGCEDPCIPEPKTKDQLLLCLGEETVQ